MRGDGALRPTGSLDLKVIRRNPEVLHPTVQRCTVTEILRLGLPKLSLEPEVRAWRTANFSNLMRGVRDVALARLCRAPTWIGLLYLTKIERGGRVIHYGLAGARVVTTVGVNFIVDAFQNSVELEIMKYHGIGTGTNAENASDTALQTEATTAYNPNSTRATGTTTEGASANIYRTVATNTVDGAVACTEHGIFSDPAVGSGVLLDRTVFSVVNLASGDSLQSTYELTVASGG